VTWSAFRDAKTRSAWRSALLEEQGGLCVACGYRFPTPGELSDELRRNYSATFDHVVPRSQGGADELSNLRLVHAICNRARGDGNGSNRVPSIPRALRL
jgi:5-methylcytosine-specific restriction endonuclease McrA